MGRSMLGIARTWNFLLAAGLAALPLRAGTILPVESLNNCGPHVLNDFRNLCNPGSPTSICFNTPFGTDGGNLSAAFWDLCGGKFDCSWKETKDLCSYAEQMRFGTFSPVDLRNQGHWVGLYRDDAGNTWIRCTQSGSILPLDPKILASNGFDISDVCVFETPLPTKVRTAPCLDDPNYPSWKDKRPLLPEQTRPHLPTVGGRPCASSLGVGLKTTASCGARMMIDGADEAAVVCGTLGAMGGGSIVGGINMLPACGVAGLGAAGGLCVATGVAFYYVGNGMWWAIETCFDPFGLQNTNRRSPGPSPDLPDILPPPGGRIQF